MSEMRPLTYATVCSGVECMGAAVADLPMRPVFFAEIEPFPCAVLRHRYPDVPNLGDMGKISVSQDGKEVTNGTDRILLGSRLDVLAGGTPCQDVSSAGLRRGMSEGSGTRSSLAFEFVRLVRELRPRYVLWENVAGVLSDPSFPGFLSALAECGYGLAYRTLDAQWTRCADIHRPDGGVVRLERAVPQRRRRVWVVGCAGGDIRRASEVLFEREGLAGDHPPRRVAGQEAARPSPAGDGVAARVVGAAGFDPFEPGGVKSVNAGHAGTLINGTCPGQHNAVVQAFENHAAEARVAYGMNPQGGKKFLPFHEECGETLAVCHGGGVCLSYGDSVASMRYVVRRFTPTECERLMGLPDGWTLPAFAPSEITDALVEEFRRIHDTFGAVMAAYAGRPAPRPKTAAWVRRWLERISDPATCPDAPRYKACGDGWATNQPRWIILRILFFERIDPWNPEETTEPIETKGIAA